jgi:hypothetical protein
MQLSHLKPTIRNGKALVTGLAGSDAQYGTYLLEDTIVTAPPGMPKSSDGKRDIMINTLIYVNPLRSGNSRANSSYSHTQTVRYIAID